MRVQSWEDDRGVEGLVLLHFVSPVGVARIVKVDGDGVEGGRHSTHAATAGWYHRPLRHLAAPEGFAPRQRRR